MPKPLAGIFFFQVLSPGTQFGFVSNLQVRLCFFRMGLEFLAGRCLTSAWGVMEAAEIPVPHHPLALWDLLFLGWTSFESALDPNQPLHPSGSYGHLLLSLGQSNKWPKVPCSPQISHFLLASC